MRTEYDFSNARKNPYVVKKKRNKLPSTWIVVPSITSKIKLAKLVSPIKC